MREVRQKLKFPQNKDGENNPVNSSVNEIPQPSPMKINSRLKFEST